jgi:hypothetical protein
VVYDKKGVKLRSKDNENMKREKGGCGFVPARH